MREIKFRFWQVDKVLKSAFMDKPMTLREIADYASEPKNKDWGNRIYLVSNSSCTIPMQYTGFKDSKGKEIYESDILKINDYVYEVYWNEYNFWCLKPLSKETIRADMSRQMLETDSVVIGNFYENKEWVDVLDKVSI